MTLENVRQKALWNKQPQSTIALLVNSADGCLDTEHFPHTDEQTVNSQRCLVSLSNNGLLPDYKHTKHTQYLTSSLFNDLYSIFFFNTIVVIVLATLNLQPFPQALKAVIPYYKNNNYQKIQKYKSTCTPRCSKNEALTICVSDHTKACHIWLFHKCIRTARGMHTTRTSKQFICQKAKQMIQQVPVQQSHGRVR